LPRIATGCTAASRERPYDDGFTDGGFLRYRYHGTDPNHRDNVGLRTAMQRQTPLIYLRGIVQGLYEPAWPVFIVEDHPEALTFIVAIDDQVGARPGVSSRPVACRGLLPTPTSTSPR